MLIACLLVFCVLGGISIGVIFGLQIQRHSYDKWFKEHCYFCCNKFNATEDTDKTASFETDLTNNQNAHLICWERNMFSYDEEGWDAGANS